MQTWDLPHAVPWTSQSTKLNQQAWYTSDQGVQDLPEDLQEKVLRSLGQYLELYLGYCKEINNKKLKSQGAGDTIDSRITPYVLLLNNNHLSSYKNEEMNIIRHQNNGFELV